MKLYNESTSCMTSPNKGDGERRREGGASRWRPKKGDGRVAKFRGARRADGGYSSKKIDQHRRNQIASECFFWRFKCSHISCPQHLSLKMTPSTPQRQQGNSDATFSSPPVKRPPSPEDSDADENDLLRHSLWGWKSKIDTTPSKRRALSDRDPNSKWTDEGRGWSPIPTTPPPKEADPVDLFSTLPTEM